MSAEAVGIAERGGFGGPAATGQRFEVAEVRALLPGAAALVDELVDAEVAQPFRLRAIAREREPGRAAARTSCSRTTSAVMSCSPGASSGPLARSCDR